MANAEKYLLQVSHLTCGYGRKEIVRDVSFDVAGGEVFGIIGPNGSGKTTLVRAMSRVIKPFGGEIRLEGKDIDRIDSRLFARQVAVVSQNLPAGFVRLQDFVLFGRIPYFRKFQFLETGADLDAAVKAMELTGTAELRDRFLEELSGGERQLAAVARALCQEPTLLFLDEPTSHLDIAHQIAVLDLVRRLNASLKLSVVMILHDLNLASEYCDRLLILKQGSVYRVGSPQEVLTYQNIEDVYRTLVVVKDSPVSGKPHVLLVTERDRQKDVT